MTEFRTVTWSIPKPLPLIWKYIVRTCQQKPRNMIVEGTTYLRHHWMVINLGMQRLGYPLKLGIGTSGITGLVSGEIHTCRLTFSLQNRALLIFTVVIMIFIQFEETKNDAWYPTPSQLPTTTVCRLVSPVGFYGPPYNSGGHRWWQCGKSTNPSTSKSSGQWSGAG